jgi:hypothetical protein
LPEQNLLDLVRVHLQCGSFPQLGCHEKSVANFIQFDF